VNEDEVTKEREEQLHAPAGVVNCEIRVVSTVIMTPFLNTLRGIGTVFVVKLDDTIKHSAASELDFNKKKNAF
jgi:hypothetical protein